MMQKYSGRFGLKIFYMFIGLQNASLIYKIKGEFHLLESAT